MRLYCEECGDDAHPGQPCDPVSLRAMGGVRRLFGEGALEMMAAGLGAEMVPPDVSNSHFVPDNLPPPSDPISTDES